MFTKNAVYILRIEYYIVCCWRHAFIFSFLGNNSIKLAVWPASSCQEISYGISSILSSNTAWIFFLVLNSGVPLRFGTCPYYKRTDITFKKITTELFSNIIRLFKTFSFELLIRSGGLFRQSHRIFCISALAE